MPYLAQNPAPEDTPAHVTAARGYIVFTFAMALLLALAWKLRTVLELVYVSALFAVVLLPIVARIRKLRVRGYSPSRTVAILILVLGVAVLLIGFFVIGLPPVLRDAQHFFEDLPGRIPAIIVRAKALPLVNHFNLDALGNKAEGAASATAQYIFAKAPGLLGGLLDVVTALFLCIYFMLEGDVAYAYFLSFFPQNPRRRLSATLQVAETRMSKWLIGQGLLMLILGVCSTTVFGILHVRYFLLLGVLMGLFNIIPIIGGVITILLAAGIAATDSWGKMLGVFIFYFIYIQLENAVLTPRIMKSSVDLMGLTVIISLLVGSEVAGVVGALVAVPTAALISVLVGEYLVRKDPEAQQTLEAKPADAKT